MKRIILSFISFILIISGIQPAAAIDNREIDIVAITWPGASSPTVTVNDVKTSIENDVTKRWNYLAQNWPDGINFKVGSVVTTPIQMTTQLICDGTES